MFDWNFRVWLRQGKYTHWASHLSGGHIAFLLWKVGEFGCHANQVLILLEKHSADVIGCMRAHTALINISEFVLSRGQLDLSRIIRSGGLGVSIFSEEFRQHLVRGKYTNWARDITDNQLEFLLWQVGEFGYRASGVLDHLEERSEEATAPGEFIKAKASLESIKMIFSAREKLDVTKGESREIDISLGNSECECWPDAVQDALCKAAPELNWRWVIKTDKGYHLQCRNAWNRIVQGEVTNDGKIEIRTSVPVDEVPEVVRTALTKQKPGGKQTKFWAVGPDSRTLRYYECLIIDGLSSSLVRIGNDVHRNDLVLSWLEKLKRLVPTRKN